MTWLKWYDPNPSGPHDLLLCDWRGNCETLIPTPSAGCYVAETQLEGALTGTLLRGSSASPESQPVYVPEPSGMFLGGLLLLILLGRRRRAARHRAQPVGAGPE